MFDLFNGLPVHPLVVHAAVVLIPLTMIGTILIVVRRKWRKTLGWWVVGLSAVSLACAVAAKESGEQLAARIGEPEVHAELGDTLPLFAGVMFIATTVLVVADRLLDRNSDSPSAADDGSTPVLVTLLGIVAVVVALGATFQTYRVGDSGAQAVWAEEIAATQAGGSADQTVTPEEESESGTEGSATPSPTPSSGAAATGAITMAQVKGHSTASDCWTTIAGKVYDLTSWEGLHPGGAQVIIGLCGTDGTSAFDAQHGGQSQPEQELASFKIGTLG